MLPPPLLALCLLSAPQQELLHEDFDVLCEEVASRYAYHDRTAVDWGPVRAAFRPRAESVQSKGELLALLEDALEALRDHHVHLGVNGASSPRLVPSHVDLWLEWIGGEARVTSVRLGSDAARAGIVPGDVVRSLGGRDVAELAALRLGLSEAGLLERVGVSNRGAVDWALRAELAGRWDQPRTLTVEGRAGERTLTLGDGWAPRRDGPLFAGLLGEGDERVGYVRLHDSLGNSAAVARFDAALGQLRGVDALIVDLRETPGGGNSSVARGILGHFVTSPRPYQRHVLVEEERATGIPRSWTEEVWPRAPHFAGRVLVLVGRWTGSMGEGLALGFDAIGAEVVGGPMSGLLGALLEVELPRSGWVVRFANEALTHVDGTPREAWRPPVLVADATPGDDVDDVLEAALERAREER
ncbi:MAG: S41 family peptidase [Planctomycetota bacterium]